MTSSLLAIFAHPDDEGIAGGTIAKYAANGTPIVLACATRGEVGEISEPPLATSDTLGAVREAELRAACDVLGVQELRFLGYRDSGMAGTPENDDPRCYHQADPETATRQLVGLIREVKPQIVLTFEPGGGYGHPDHIAASRYATAAFDSAGDPEIFPEAGQPWQPRRLFYVAFPRTMFIAWRDRMEALGLDTSPLEQFNLIEQDPVDDQITHTVDVSAQIAVKWAAFNSHQTQFGADHFFHQLPEEARGDIFGREYFIQARPALPASTEARMLDDLFAGL